MSLNTMQLKNIGKWIRSIATELGATEEIASATAKEFLEDLEADTTVVAVSFKEDGTPIILRNKKVAP